MSLLDTEGFQVSNILRRWWRNGKRRIERRLDKTKLGDCGRPMFTARNIHYEPSQRCRGMGFGGIGAMNLLARRIGLIDDISNIKQRAIDAAAFAAPVGYSRVDNPLQAMKRR